MSEECVLNGETYHACTGWSVEDVLDSAEAHAVKISNEEALQLLKDNASKIVDAMVQEGWFVINELIQEWGDR